MSLLPRDPLKSVATTAIEEKIARAVSELVDKEFEVSIKNIEFKNLGADITLSVWQPINFPTEKETK